MAGAGVQSFGNQQLWQTISGTGFLLREDIIEVELNRNKDKLVHGLGYYKNQTTPSGEALKSKNLKQDKNDFIIKLGQFLGLDEVQSYDLFCSYLFTEYKGSQKELAHLLKHERNSQALVLKIQEFYQGERLYLLRCLRHILHCWLEGEHVYKNTFIKFLDQLLDQNLLGKKLQSQFETICNSPVPTKDINGPLMGRNQVQVWVHQNLREQVELLELLLVYYKNFEMDLSTLLHLCSTFKRQGFGWGQSYKHLVDRHTETLVHRIGYLELLLLLEGLDVMNAVDTSRENKFTDHVVLGNLKGMEKLEAAIAQLGSEPIHGPLLLAWSVLQYIQAQVEGSSGSHGSEAAAEATMSGGGGKAAQLTKAAQRLGHQALQLGAFDFILDMLEVEPFSGESDVASITHYLVYSLMTALLSFYHEDSLGNTEALYRLAAKLFKWEFIADNHWQKRGGEAEGLGILYESSKLWFPLDFLCFVQLNISLANASSYSAQQVRRELLMLQTYTEALDNNRAQDLHTSTEQGVFVLRRDKRPYQNSSFVIEQKSKGTVINPASIRRSLGGVNHVIRWDTCYNGWQILMAEVQELLGQVAQGAGMVQTDQLLRATMVMELVKEVLTSDPDAVPEFKEMLALAYQLIARFSVLSPCPLELVSHTIQCLACAVPLLHTQVSHHLGQTGFLPFLMENIDSYSEVLSGDGVNQGLYGTILAGTECAHGVYMVTMATLDLLTQLVKVSLKKKPSSDSHINSNLAGILFILREVFPRYYKWRYADISHRKSIGQKCLQLFHHIFNFAHLPKKAVEREAKRGPNLQECCVFSLLFTEAGRALLEIMATGVDTVQQTLAQQTSLLEGAGSDLIELLEMSLSVVNRLLLLKPASLADHVSPVEQALASSQHRPGFGGGGGGGLSSAMPGHAPFHPQGHQQRHLVATVAQYIYHRHSHRLPFLATLLLKRLATVHGHTTLAFVGVVQGTTLAFVGVVQGTTPAFVGVVHGHTTLAFVGVVQGTTVAIVGVVQGTTPAFAGVVHGHTTLAFVGVVQGTTPAFVGVVHGHTTLAFVGVVQGTTLTIVGVVQGTTLAIVGVVQGTTLTIVGVVQGTALAIVGVVQGITLAIVVVGTGTTSTTVLWGTVQRKSRDTANTAAESKVDSTLCDKTGWKVEHTDVSAVRGTAGTVVEGTGVSAVRGTAGTVVEGTDVSAVRGTAGTVVEGTDVSAVRSTAGAVVEGTGVSAVRNTAGTVVEGTDVSAVRGTAGTIVEGTDVSAVRGTAGTVVEHTDVSAVRGTAGTVVEGTGVSAVRGTAGTVVEGTGVSVVRGTAGTVVEGTDVSAVRGTDGTIVERTDVSAVRSIDGTIVEGTYESAVRRTASRAADDTLVSTYSDSAGGTSKGTAVSTVTGTTWIKYEGILRRSIACHQLTCCSAKVHLGFTWDRAELRESTGISVEAGGVHMNPCIHDLSHMGGPSDLSVCQEGYESVLTGREHPSVTTGVRGKMNPFKAAILMLLPTALSLVLSLTSLLMSFLSPWLSVLSGVLLSALRRPPVVRCGAASVHTGKLMCLPSVAAAVIVYTAIITELCLCIALVTLVAFLVCPLVIRLVLSTVVYLVAMEAGLLLHLCFPPKLRWILLNIWSSLERLGRAVLCGHMIRVEVSVWDRCRVLAREANLTAGQAVLTELPGLVRQGRCVTLTMVMAWSYLAQRLLDLWLVLTQTQICACHWCRPCVGAVCVGKNRKADEEHSSSCSTCSSDITSSTATPTALPPYPLPPGTPLPRLPHSGALPPYPPPRPSSSFSTTYSVMLRIGIIILLFLSLTFLTLYALDYLNALKKMFQKLFRLSD